MSWKFNTIPPKRLSRTIASTDYSFSLSDILGFDGIPLTSTIVGDTIFGSFQNASGTVLELFTIDTATIANSSITILKRGLQFNEDGTYTEVAANKLTWVKGVTIVQLGTDAPGLFQKLKSYIDGIAIAGSPNASTILQGLVQIATLAQINAGTAVGSTGASLVVTPDQLALSTYVPTLLPPGVYFPYSGRTAPAGYLLMNGATQLKASYTALFAILYPSFTVTATIASPGVFTTTGSHGFVVGDQVSFSTTGGLPSGIVVGTNYFVISTGLTATSFELALTPGGPAINTTGSQSGVHTVYWSNYGPYDGTNFHLPDTRGVTLIGAAGASTTVLSFDPTVISGNVITVPDGDFPVQGQAVVYTAAGTPIGGLTSTTTYYVVRLSSTTISLASTQANANIAVVISLSGSPTGPQVLTYTTQSRTLLGKRFGEDTHGLAKIELSNHDHNINRYSTGGSTATVGAQVPAGSTVVDTVSLTGSNNINGTNGSQHNIIQPSMVTNFIIKT